MRHVAIVIGIAAILGMGAATLKDADAASSKAAPKLDTKAGPAYMTLQGKLTKIEGDFYVVEDFEGREHKVHVGKDTKYLNGGKKKKPGDSIRAEVTKGFHANSIQ